MSKHAPQQHHGNDGVSDSELSDTIEDLLVPAEPGEQDPQRIASSYEAHAIDLEQDGLDLLEGVWGTRVQDLIEAAVNGLRTEVVTKVDRAEDNAAAARAASASYRTEIDGLKRELRVRDQVIANLQKDLNSLKATVTILTTRFRTVAQPNPLTTPPLPSAHQPATSTPNQTILRPQMAAPAPRVWSFDA